MANYIAVIELNDAENEEDLDQLDSAMAERGFLSQIRDDENKVFWLPRGSYAVQNTDMLLKAAHDSALAAAAESGFDFSLLVTAFDECEWTNLDPVEQTPAN